MLTLMTVTLWDLAPYVIMSTRRSEYCMYRVARQLFLGHHWSSLLSLVSEKGQIPYGNCKAAFSLGSKPVPANEHIKRCSIKERASLSA